VYYVDDQLGSSRVVTNSAGTVLDQSDFYPFGGERVIASSSGNVYKFEGKERDAETINDNFGARYYSSRFGRWLSPDWSSTPAPVPYANLTNPQTLNLYAMARDNPETFADLDGHVLPSPDLLAIMTGAATAGQNASQQAAQNQVQVQASVIEQGKIVQGEKQQDGTSVTGVRGIIQDTIAVNGKPLTGVAVDEKNTSTVTLNGQVQPTGKKEGLTTTTNNAGQLNDTVGLLAPARTPTQDKPLIQLLKTQAVTVTNKNTITFTVPGGSKYSATATRTLTNVGSNGKVNSSYTLSTSKPVVSAVP
jgi:RHS repeat-associated protein